MGNTLGTNTRSSINDIEFAKNVWAIFAVFASVHPYISPYVKIQNISLEIKKSETRQNTRKFHFQEKLFRY